MSHRRFTRNGQSKNYSERKRKATDPKYMWITSLLDKALSHEDLGGPTPENYMGPDDDSAWASQSFKVKTVSDIVNKELMPNP